MKSSIGEIGTRAAGSFRKLIALAMLSPLLFVSLPYADAEAAPRVAVISRVIPAPVSDKPYVDHLRSRGWQVTVIDDDRIRDSGRGVISGFDLVVVSSTVFSQRILGRLRDAPEPIIVAKPDLFRWFHLTSFSRNDWGYTTSSRKVNVVRPWSPLAGDLSGEVTVGTNAKPMNFGKVGSGAQIVATARDNPNQPVIFAYDRGSRLASGESAKGRRVGFYMSQTHPTSANRDGWALFDAAAAWLSPAAPDAPSDPVGGNESLVPNNGALFGVDVTRGDNNNRYEAVVEVERLINRDLAIIARNHEFSAGLTSTFFWDRRHVEDGRTVMVLWRATDNPGSVNGERDPQRARKIVTGQFDRQIDAMATAMRDLEAPVLMAFAWEMDQDLGQPQFIGSPSEFIAAWRYVHNRFQQRGATNVEWVWAPRARSFAKNDGQTFYPGYDYVDWVGGFSVPIDTYEDPVTIYNAWNQWAINIGKPQLLWIGLNENPNDRNWKQNFIDQLRSLTTGPWVGVKALVYYSAESPLGKDYYIDTSPQALSAIRRLACDPHYTTTDRC